MALSAFDDKSHEPRASELQAALGRAGARWEELVTYIASEYAPLTTKWGFAGLKWGWSLRLTQKNRTALYMTPQERRFLVGFALGEKAVRAAHAIPLDESVLALIDEAPRYAEGRGVRIEVRTKKDIETVKRLAVVKMAN